jgi:hypothetical protein
MKHDEKRVGGVRHRHELRCMELERPASKGMSKVERAKSYSSSNTYVKYLVTLGAVRPKWDPQKGWRYLWREKSGRGLA